MNCAYNKNKFYLIFKLLLSVLTRKVKTGSIFNFLILAHDIYYKNEYKLPFSFDGKVIFDIGANVGLFSLWMKAQYKDSKIHAFEPTKNCFNILKFNLPNSNVNHLALGNNITTSHINYYPLASGFSTLKNDIQEKVKNMPKMFASLISLVLKHSHKEEIQVQTAKKYIIDNNLNHIDLCKIDVEGCELDVLKGFGDYLENVEHFLIEIETFREENLKAVLKLLSSYKATTLRVMNNCQVIHFQKIN